MPYSTDFPLTYGQRLRRIMQDNHLTVSDMCRRLGYKSPTQLTRILNDEVSPTLITKFHSQFMLIFDWLISPAEIRALSTSMQYSCMGHDAFLTRRAMYQMLFEPPAVSAENLILRLSPEREGNPYTFSDMIAQSATFKQIDLLIIGSGFDRLLPLFSSLKKGSYPLDRLHIRHYFVMEENVSQFVSQVSALVPFLNAGNYSGFYCTQTAPHAAQLIRQNPVALARAVSASGRITTALFLAPQEDGLPACRVEGDTLYAFYNQLIAAHQDKMRPIKSVYPHPRTVESLLTLCQRDLFLEQNHACCFVKLDLCFPVLPASVVLEAVDHGAKMGLSLDSPVMQELIRVHTARHENLRTKKEATIFILTRHALLDFTRTGHMSDHLYAMRDFTPSERKIVLLALLDALNQNPSLSIHFTREDALTPVGCFCAYEDLGLQLASNHTGYDMQDSHSEVFVGLPELASSFMHYCTSTFIPESCMTREESIAWLTELVSAIDSQLEP